MLVTNSLTYSIVELSTSSNQGGRSWQHFGKGKNDHKNFRQARVYYFGDKCVDFAGTCKFAHLLCIRTTHNILVHFFAQTTLFLTQKALSLPKDFQEVFKSRQILISRQNSIC